MSANQTSDHKVGGDLHRRNREHWMSNGFRFLLTCLLLYMVLGPFYEDRVYAEAAISTMLTLVLVSGVVALTDSRRYIMITGGLLAASVILLWLQTLQVITSTTDWSAVGLAGCLALLIYSFSKQLFKVKEVSANVLCAGLCVYLMMGILWGCIFAVMESLAPGSFSGTLLDSSDTVRGTSRHLEYFSFVTLSTVGYGDITPQSRGAAALCQAEAIFGQFYVLVLIARLVSIQTSQQTNT